MSVSLFRKEAGKGTHNYQDPRQEGLIQWNKCCTKIRQEWFLLFSCKIHCLIYLVFLKKHSFWVACFWKIERFLHILLCTRMWLSSSHYGFTHPTTSIEPSSSGWPQIHRDPDASTSWVPRLKVCATTLWHERRKDVLCLLLPVAQGSQGWKN